LTRDLPSLEAEGCLSEVILYLVGCFFIMPFLGIVILVCEMPDKGPFSYTYHPKGRGIDLKAPIPKLISGVSHVSDDIPEWAMTAARHVYGRLIFGENFGKILDEHKGLQHQYDEERIRGCARVIVQCRREVII
jgi:hypothetical protein